MSNTQNNTHLLWVDLEMTGLIPEVHTIIEFAMIITDAQLKPLHTYHSPVFQEPQALDLMDDWCQKTHTDSGLVAKIPTAPLLIDIEQQVCKDLDQFFNAKDKIVLAGNSIGQDKRFIDLYMPALSKRLHYRTLDVSSFKEVFSRCYQHTYPKNSNHIALDDIQASIDELKHYMQFININKDASA